MNARAVLNLALLVLVIGGALYTRCGNFFESSSCVSGCRDRHEACLLTAAIYQTTPNGAQAPSAAVLFLGCQSALYVCEDTCGSGVSRE